MTGLVGAVGQRNVAPLLVESLKRLEYRRYDSAGLALLRADGQQLEVCRCVGRVAELERRLAEVGPPGALGIAHTRRGTHGAPAERNTHPQVSRGEIAVVHNGDIDSYRMLRAMLEAKGYEFQSDTDTEVIAHLVHAFHKKKGAGLFGAVQDAVRELPGRYAIAVVAASEPDCLVVSRQGSPLVIGISADGQLVASDIAALLPWTRRCIFLEDGDVAELRRDDVSVVDRRGLSVIRSLRAL